MGIQRVITEDTQDLATVLLASRWEAMRDEVTALTSYPADWDGEGADRVHFPLIQATLRWFEWLESNGAPAPAAVYPTAGGTPVVEWYASDKSSYVAYVRKPDRVDIVYRLPGGEPTHVVVAIVAKGHSSAPGALWISTQSIESNFQTESALEGYQNDSHTDSDSSYCQAA